MDYLNETEEGQARSTTLTVSMLKALSRLGIPVCVLRCCSADRYDLRDMWTEYEMQVGLMTMPGISPDPASLWGEMMCTEVERGCGL